MAEREVFVRWKFGGDDPEAEVGKAKTAFKDLGTYAKTAGKEAGEAFDPATKDLARLEAASNQVMAALTKLQNTPVGRTLTVEAAKAATALDKLEEELKQSGAQATKTGAEIARALEMGRKSIDQAVQSAAKFKDTMGDFAKQGKLGAEGAQTLAGSMGSLSGVFSLADDAGKGWVSTMGKAGLVGLAITEGWKLLTSVGEGLGKAIADLIDKQTAHQAALMKTADTTARIATATKLAEKGMIDFGGSTTELLANMDRYILKQGLAGQATKEFILAGLGMKDVAVEAEAVSVKAKNLGAILDSELKQKGVGAYRAFILANKDAILSLAEQERILTGAWSTSTRAAVKVIQDHEKATKMATDANKALGKSYEENAKAAEKLAAGIVELSKKEAAAVVESDKTKTAAIENYEAQVIALRKMGLSEDEYHAKKRALLLEMEAKVEEASKKEELAAKETKEALDAKARGYERGVSSLKDLIAAQAGSISKTKEEVLGAKDAEEVQKQLTKALAAQEAQYGPTKTAAEKLRDAVAQIEDPAKKAADSMGNVATKSGDVDKAFNAIAAKSGGALKGGFDEAERAAGGLLEKFQSITSEAPKAVNAMDEVARAAGRMQDAIAAAAGARKNANSEPGKAATPAPGGDF